MPQQITLSLLFLQMPWVDASGDPHDGSIWYPQSVTLDNYIFGGGAGITWVGYRDVVHFASRAAPIGQFLDSTTGPEFFAVIQQPVVAGASHAADSAQTYATLALSHKTLPATNSDGTLQTDPATGQPVMKSFFDGAQVVMLPVTITQ